MLQPSKSLFLAKFELVYNGTKYEVKVNTDIDGIDAGKPVYAKSHAEAKLESSRDERGNYRELVFSSATIDESRTSQENRGISSSGTIQVKVASGSNVEVYESDRRGRSNNDRRYHRQEGELVSALALKLRSQECSHNFDLEGIKPAYVVGTSHGRILEPARDNYEREDRGGRYYRDEPYNSRGYGGNAGGRLRQKFEEDGKVDVMFTIWYTSSFGFRKLTDLVDPGEWTYVLMTSTFNISKEPFAPNLDLGAISSRTWQVHPMKMPDIPALTNSSLDRMIENIATSCKVDLVRTAEMNLYYCLSILLFDTDSYHQLIYSAIEKELNFNERYYLPFLENERGFFVPLLAFANISRCHFLVFLGDKIQGQQESIIQFSFAPTPFPTKAYALGCLSREKFFALKYLSEPDADPMNVEKRRKAVPRTRAPVDRSQNLVVID